MSYAAVKDQVRNAVAQSILDGEDVGEEAFNKFVTEEAIRSTFLVYCSQITEELSEEIVKFALTRFLKEIASGKLKFSLARKEAPEPVALPEPKMKVSKLKAFQMIHAILKEDNSPRTYEELSELTGLTHNQTKHAVNKHYEWFEKTRQDGSSKILVALK